MRSARFARLRSHRAGRFYRLKNWAHYLEWLSRKGEKNCFLRPEPARFNFALKTLPPTGEKVIRKYLDLWALDAKGPIQASTFEPLGPGNQPKAKGGSLL